MSMRLLSTRTLCQNQNRNWLFQVFKADQQQVANYSAEETEKSKPVPYKKVNYSFKNARQNRSLSQPRLQNFSMSTDSQQALPSNNISIDKQSNKLVNDNYTNKPSNDVKSEATFKLKKKSDEAEYRERLTNIRYFYADHSIDKLNEKPLVRLNPISMMYMGVSDDNSHLLKTSNYLRHELPIRLAHMIKEIRHLPFIIAVNPHILEILERCIKQFHKFDNFEREIKDKETETEFSQMVFNMLNMNKDLLGLLCDGFKESRRYFRDEDYIRKHISRILSSRLGIRLLCEHFLALNKHTQVSDHKNSDFVGIIHKKFSPKYLVEKSARMVSRICLDKYGRAPKLKLDGHTNVEFPYLSLPLEYILPELLKNSFRATCENHRDAEKLPDVTVTIAVNEKDCIIRLRDRGGGIPHELCDKIFDYHFTTVNEESKNDEFSLSTDGSGSDSPYNNNPMSGMLEASSSRGLAVMHGYGFGLPTSRAYAEYLGGSLTFQSMQGIGSDFYLRIALIDNEPGRVRI